MKIQNLIFDLGGVFLDIDYNRTRQAFIDLGVVDFDHFYQQSHSNPLFEQLEKGEIAPVHFYENFRKQTGLQAGDTEIARAWNAMLLGFREQSVQYLQELGSSPYRVFLFSNTNQIHLEAFREIHFRQFKHHNFDGYFEKAWYSHELGLRKPYPEAYLALTERHGLNPEETIFIDDTLKNIEGAQEAGLQTLWLKPGMLVEVELADILQQGVV